MGALQQLVPSLPVAHQPQRQHSGRGDASSCCCRLSFSSSLARVARNSLRSPLVNSPMYRCIEAESFLGSRLRDRAVSSTVVASSLLDDVSSPVLLGTALAALLSFGGFRAFVYFRIQYMIAAMLGKCVPRGGSKVLDMDIHEGRNLYYYPSDVEEVVAISTEKNRQIIQNQAIRAGVPVDVKVKALNSLSLPSNSMDAVVSVYCLCNLKEMEIKALLREAVRLLKPGKPFIFVENVEAEGDFLRSCQMIFQQVLQVFGMRSTPPKDLATMLKEARGLEKLSYETVFSYQDPHIVGLAVKETEAMESRSKKRAGKKSISA